MRLYLIYTTILHNKARDDWPRREHVAAVIPLVPPIAQPLIPAVEDVLPLLNPGVGIRRNREENHSDDDDFEVSLL